MEPELVVATDTQSPLESANRILDMLVRRGILLRETLERTVSVGQVASRP